MIKIVTLGEEGIAILEDNNCNDEEMVVGGTMCRVRASVVSGGFGALRESGLQ